MSTLTELLLPEHRQALEALGYNLEDFLDVVGAVAANPHGTHRFGVFMDDLLEKLKQHINNPANTNVLGSLNELNEFRRIVDTPGLELIEVMRKQQKVYIPGEGEKNIVGQLDAVARRASDGKKVIFELKASNSLTLPSMNAKGAHVRCIEQVQNRVSYAKDSGGEYVEVRVRLNAPNGADWDPVLKAELELIGAESGITVIVEKVNNP